MTYQLLFQFMHGFCNMDLQNYAMEHNINVDSFITLISSVRLKLGKNIKCMIASYSTICDNFRFMILQK